MITEIEIVGVGNFEVLRDLTHRSKLELKLNTNEKQFKSIQFDQNLDYEVGEVYFGYDAEANDIQILITK